MKTAAQFSEELSEGFARMGSLANYKDAVYTLVLSGQESGEFHVVVKDGMASVQADTDSPVDCVLTMNNDDFAQLLEGKLPGTTAYMMGKLKVKGDLSLALQLESLLKVAEKHVH